MSQKKVPQKRFHRGKGQDYVRDPRDGKQVLLGPAGTVESQRRYAEWVADYVRETGTAVEQVRRPTGLFDGLLLRYLEDCALIYLQLDGSLSRSYGNCVTVSRHYLHRLRGRQTSSITRADIVDIQRDMLQRGLTRKTVCEYMGIIKRLIVFGRDAELIDSHHAVSLLNIPDLRPNEGRRSKPVTPIPMRHVFAMYRALSPDWRVIFAFHLLTGQRAETALRVKRNEIDTGSIPWKYSPTMHKNTWRGKAMTILIGPRARRILTPFMGASGLLWPGQRMNCSPRRTPRPAVRSRYAYHRAIGDACERAGIPHHTLQQIRHTAATFLVGKLVPESIIGAILGHHGRGDDAAISTGSGTITGRYAAVPRRRVEAVVEKWG